jgi:uncharacterized protein YbjT (DUF2867 family)
MTSPILLTGGTGTLGRHVVPLLRDAGYEVRILSRHSHAATDGIQYLTGDLLTDEGVAAAVDGAETVLHLAGGPKDDDLATGHLVRAAAQAGVRHFVYISVVGADRVPVGWVRSKYAAERAIAESGMPWTTLRAAQFHDLVLTVAQKMGKLPVVPAPRGLRFEPVAAADVAERLVALTLDAPAGRVPDLAGPTVYPLADLVRSYLRARGRHRAMLPVRIPGKAGKAYRAGANLAGADALRGTGTWEDFLAASLAEARAAKMKR